MKKVIFAAAVAFGLLFSAPLKAAEPSAASEFIDSLPEKLVFYIPNRLLDALDSFSVNLGAGLVAQARLMCTRAIDVGAGWGTTAKLYKSHNRQYGVGIEEMWYYSLISIGEEHYSMLNNSPWVDNYVEMRAGIPDPTVRTYDFFKGPRDYWAIGGSLGFLIDGDLYLHPVEIVDFVLGFLLIDIKQDDLTLDSFSR
ncbi:MAG: hypothetical protein E7048_03665 [Lentisphaerae bacterium]|nr:hypothetical protein [Lentisphaerota bacterium]MBR2874126.1 hypothetical protein [Lentisphaeria bacterium]